MPKLSLQLDDLAVDPFQTSRHVEPRGTAHAHAEAALYATLSCKPPCNSLLNTNCPEVC